MTEDLRPTLDFAREIGLEAGRLLRSIHEERELSVQAKGTFDFVTNADLEIDRHLTSRIRSAFPDHAILSEEGTAGALPDEGYCWIIDPLDGTVNFFHGQDHVAISVALYRDGEPLVGVVHAELQGQTFWAVKGGGAYRDGEAIRLPPPAGDRQAVIATGFPSDRTNLDVLVDRLKPLLSSFGDIRRLAAPALDVCWVADGRLDAFLDRVKIWDVAAAGLIASEAGAAVIDLDQGSARPDGFDCLVAEAGLCERIIAALKGG